MKPHDRLMGLDLPHGGHLSHGYQTPTKKISHVSIYYETIPYRLDEVFFFFFPFLLDYLFLSFRIK